MTITIIIFGLIITALLICIVQALVAINNSIVNLNNNYVQHLVKEAQGVKPQGLEAIRRR